MSETHETIQIAKTQAGCGLCEEYAAREAKKPVVVMACEGACLRGELARLTANFLCDELAPEGTARLCLGGAFTKNTGQRALARNAPRVVAVEGCPILCGTRMMQGVLPELKPEVYQIPSLVKFDSKLFAMRDMPEPERKRLAREAAQVILAKL
jgi:uncharacterized metal-binding protein